MKGIVYVLTNPAMPHIVKIGFTTRGNIESRLRELFTTGVPVPFECAYACDVEDCNAVERALHIAFKPQQIHPKREFFNVDPEQPIAILKLFERKEVTSEINREIDTQTTEVDREAGEKLKKQRRPPLNFPEMGVPIGSVLKFMAEDVEAEVLVCSDKKIQYQGREYSLTHLTRELLKLDYNVNPTRYWAFDDRSLSAIYNETYGEE